MPLSIALFPARTVPDLISIICIANLFVFALVSLFKRKHRKTVLCMLSLSALLFVLSLAVMRANVFQTRFRHRILSTITPDELRGIADFVHATMPIEESLPGPRKWSLWSEAKHRPLWNALEAGTEIEKLDSSLVIINHPESVEIAWGGALMGHWGLIIAVTNTGQVRNNAKRGDIAPDIKTFVTPD